ncbi:MAG: Gfo/Idh/MocA family oxidoreductase [Bacteroidia bacterium]|nr:Gfo/Idh/MocA family oxidoreductase [Bacteroidia bacterium]
MDKQMKQNGTNEPLKNKGQAPGFSTVNRRSFVGIIASTAAAITIVPRHILGGIGFIAPSDKTTLAYIGVGTQGLRELLPLLNIPKLQIIAVCDPQKEATGYLDWGKDGLRDEIRNKLINPGWSSGGDNTIPGGRDNGKAIVDEFYQKNRPEQKLNGCNAYADFRELFEKEKDLDAVKVMTPDHLHGLIATAAIKKGKHISMHKPLSNRLLEGKQVIELARNNPKVTTHLIPWDSNGSMELVMKWIKEGKIGKLEEVQLVE